MVGIPVWQQSIQPFANRRFPFRIPVLRQAVVKLGRGVQFIEHSADIESIDAVGFELWITNHELEPATFSVYLDTLDGPIYPSDSALADNAIPKILDGLTIEANATGDAQTYVSYGESLTYLDNVAYMSDLMLDGEFHFYGVTDQGDVAGYTIDSVRVVVTVTVSY